MTSEPPKGPDDFDADDWATLKDVIVAQRKRMAVQETITTWGKWLAIASGAFVAISYFRDVIKEWLQIKGGH